MLTYLFDGVDSEQNDGHTFLSISDRDGNGVDCYFDGVGGISEVIDWQDGNGLMAKSQAARLATGEGKSYDEDWATRVASCVIMGGQYAGVVAG